MTDNTLLIGGCADGHVSLLGNQANRHGLVAGATGTGKTVTLKVLAEGFSRLGVPVFAADVKGDLSGIAAAGKPHPKIDERIESIGIDDYSAQGSPVVFWDLYQKQGHPIRTTVSEVGPLLLSRMLDLNDTQTGVIEVLFSVADAEGLLLLDLADLRAMLNHLIDHASEISRDYGLISKQSIAAIQRKLLQLERAGGKQFFGEPALKLDDLMRQDLSGRGIVNILAADELMMNPRLYSTALLWLLSELFEELPEVGDPEVPKLVFFFDEAHLLFNDAPKALVERIEQVVRLIRSKGVGVYFVTQSPSDLPDSVLGQLGNRVQHALRASTPKQRRAIKSAAESYVPKPGLDVVATIGSLGVGEALVSVLGPKGAPLPVEKTLICPPRCSFAPLAAAERKAMYKRSPVGGTYDTAVDRESAHERLTTRAEAAAKKAEEDAKREAANKAAEQAAKEKAKAEEKLRKAQEAARKKKARATKSKSRRQTPQEAMFKSAARTVGSTIARELMRGLLGSLKRR